MVRESRPEGSNGNKAGERVREMREHGGATQTVQSLGETRVNCLLKHSYEVYGTICKQTSKFHLEFSGRAPIKVLDPPVGGSYGHSTQDEDWRLQFKMWQHFQTQRYEILR